jgi:hypothetical protein
VRKPSASPPATATTRGPDRERVALREAQRAPAGHDDLLEEVGAAAAPLGTAQGPAAVGPAVPAPSAARGPQPAQRAGSRALVAGERRDAGGQRGVDLPAQLLAHEDVGRPGGEQDRHRHRAAREQRDAPAQAHGSRRRT